MNGNCPNGLSDIFDRGDVMEANCPSRRMFQHVTSKWGALALIALLGGTMRFSALRRRIGGVSERMLSLTLQQLESDGLLERKAMAVVPPHVEYTLTPVGRETALKVHDLVDWIETNIPRLEQNRLGKASA